jgi:hypothetical protein
MSIGGGEKSGSRGVSNITIYNNIVNVWYTATPARTKAVNFHQRYLHDNVTFKYNTFNVRRAAGTTTNIPVLDFGTTTDAHFKNCIIANNIFNCICAANSYLISVDTSSGGKVNSTCPGITWSNNVYHHSTGPETTIFYDGTGKFEATAIKDDPEFSNVLNGDFHLNATSPAINTATAIYTVAKDFDGNQRPFSTGYDIGAYEWSGMLNVIISAFQSNFNKRFCVDLLNLSATVTNAMWVFLVIQTPRGAYINESLLENYSLATNGYWCNRTFSNGEPSGSLHYGYPDVRYGNGTYHAYIFAKNANGSAYSSTVDFKIYPNADVNMNGYVQPSDINYITSHDWGGNGASHFCVSDTNGNGHVQPSDIGFVTSLVHGWGWNGSP